MVGNLVTYLGQPLNEGLNRQLIELNSAHADGGPRSRICARYTLHSAPHRHERKFSGARVCRVTFKHLPQPLEVISEVSEP